MTQASGSQQRLVTDPNSVMDLIPRLQSTENTDGILRRGLVDQHLLESSFQRLVLLNVLAILVVGRGTDASDLTTGQGGLQKVGRIHTPTGGTGTDNRVHLVNEENNFSLAFGDLLQNTLESLLELAPHGRSGHQSSEVEPDQTARRLHAVGNITIEHTLGNAFGNSRLAHARIANENRVVFRSSRQNLNGAADLIVTPNHRIQLALPSTFREVNAILVQGIVHVLRRARIGRALLLPQLLDGPLHLGILDALPRQGVAGEQRILLRQRQ
mmetsp:Transcript_31284/g.91611  ORF Transcript_31284/g.91611 Transcript_31284/m.91611 type:complete len:270 (-) Transcript_31284:780-1589(-)